MDPNALKIENTHVFACLHLPNVFEMDVLKPTYIYVMLHLKTETSFLSMFWETLLNKSSITIGFLAGGLAGWQNGWLTG